MAYSFCLGSVRIVCAEGYLLLEQDCGAPELCFDTMHGSGERQCRLSTDKDTRCNGITGEHELVCDGNTLVECYSGYATSLEDCGSKTCTPGPLASCQ